MKKIIKFIVVVGTLGLLSQACSLDRFPTDRVVLENAFLTFEDAVRFHNGLYNELRRCHYGVFTTTSELMSDLFNARRDFGNRGGMPHQLGTDFAGSYEIRDIWGNVFASIAQVNFFLNNIGSIDDLTTTQQISVDNFIAEAHYIRAFLYTILAGHYMYPYSVANRNTPELGLPLVTIFDIQQRASRATIAETFAFILSDLDAAKHVEREGAPGERRVSQDAVHALMARVLFMMRDNVRAAHYANLVINTDRYPLVTTEAALRVMWTRDISSEDIFLLDVTATSFGTAAVGAGANFNDAGLTSTWTANHSAGGGGMGIFAAVNAAAGGYHPDFIPTQAVLDLYAANDIRLNVFFSDPVDQPLILGTSPFPGVRFLYKFRGNLDIGVMYLHRPRVHRIAEMYLIAAEAEQNLDRLNELRVARGLDALAAWDEQELRNEWVREFIGEGFRIQSLRRWGIEGLSHWGLGASIGRLPQDPMSVHNFGMPDYTNRIITETDFYRFTLPIPQDELRNNANMRQTPSWQN